MARSQIAKGSKGDDVKYWQNYLIGKGYDLGKYGADGDFGDATYAATVKYQQDMGLDVDGIVGEQTWGSIGTGPAYTESDPFTYDPYTESDAVKNAGIAADAADAEVAKLLEEGFTYENEQLSKDIMSEYLNRGPFSYDFNGDALYQQYKDKYMKQGKIAMQDTMGQAAAMTGGYGNSYAATAGNQAYQANLEKLNDIIPELQQMAYDRYIQDGQTLKDKYSMLSADRAQQLGEWEAGYNRAVDNRDYLRGVHNSERAFDYGKWSDNTQFEYDQWTDQRAFDYAVNRDAVEDAQWAADHAEDIRQFDETQKKNDEVIDLGDDGDYEYTPPKQPQVDPNSAAITSFQTRIGPASQHDAIARQMYGPYNAYVAVELAKDTTLTDAEKAYLIQKYGITQTDINYARDKGYDI